MRGEGQRCDNLQARACLCESHMTFNKFQMLIAFQSMVTARRGVERRTLD